MKIADMTADQLVELDRKIEVAIGKIMQRIGDLEDPYKFFIGHSGGKDSTTVYNLTKVAMRRMGRNPEDPDRFPIVIHNPKNDTHADTVDFLYELTKSQVVMFVPSKLMDHCVRGMGLVLEIDGTRKAEFTRTDKSSNYISNGVEYSRENMPDFVENGIFGLDLLYPIYDWSDDEVFAFHDLWKLKLSKEYTQ